MKAPDQAPDELAVKLMGSLDSSHRYYHSFRLGVVDTMGEVMLSKYILASLFGNSATYSSTPTRDGDFEILDYDHRWNADAALGSAVTITYSFIDQSEIDDGFTSGNDFVDSFAGDYLGTPEGQKENIRAILDYIESITLIDFVEVTRDDQTEGHATGGDLAFVMSTGSGGVAELVDRTDGSVVKIGIQGALESFDGDINTASSEIFLSSLRVAYHEIGHALGLTHPRELGWQGVDENGDFVVDLDHNTVHLNDFEAHLFNSLMNTGTGHPDLQSFILRFQDASSLSVSTELYDLSGGYGIYDVAALQFLYGENTAIQTGDNTYDYEALFPNLSAGILIHSNTVRGGLSTIVDGGGTDTIDASQQNMGVVIDLTPGAHSSIGEISVAQSDLDFIVLSQSDAIRSSFESPLAGLESTPNSGVFAGEGDIILRYEDVFDPQNYPSYLRVDVDDVNIHFGFYKNVAISFETIIENATGSDFDDTLTGNAAANRLEGNDGQDVLMGGTNNDTLVGGAGDDTLTGGGDYDVFLYDATWGDDVITDFENGVDRIDLTGSGLLYSDLVITSVDGGTLIDAGGHGTIFLSRQSAAFIDADDFGPLRGDFGTEAADTLVGAAAPDTLHGMDGADLLRGETGADRLYGDDGNDTLMGGGANDQLRGGFGNDLSRGEGGNDVLYGDVGNDTLDGGAGFDTASYFESAAAVSVDLSTGGLTGQAKGDIYVDIEHVTGSKRSDVITGDDSDNRIKGMDGWDTLNGAGGDDTIEAGGGHDVVDGGDGDDLITGGGRRDDLRGGEGSDTIDGGTGNDTLTGGAGDDVLTGGAHKDAFVFANGSGNDRITDFQVSLDSLDLRDTTAGFSEIEDVLAASTEVDGGLLIDLGGGDSVLLQGLTMDDLAQAQIDL